MKTQGPAKKKAAVLADGERITSDKFRTTPIKSTMRKIRGLPKSAILYKCQASPYWQFRVYLEGKHRKRTTGEESLEKAERAGKLAYAEMLKTVNESEKKAEPTSRRSLEHVASALWAKNEVRIRQNELHKDKNSKDQYVYDRHIKPYFSGYDLKDIDAEAMEGFKAYLADKELSKATQLSYLQLIVSILKEAVAKRYIHAVPPVPKVRLDDETRGYFDPTEYTNLWQTAKSSVDKVYNFIAKDGAVYRKTRITIDCYEVIMFMRNTYIRPTDLAVLKHRHVHNVSKDGVDFIELRHPATKRHKNFMLSTEHAPEHYRKMKERQAAEGHAGPDDFLFMPETTNRTTAMDAIASQFTAVLELSGLRRDAEGKARTLYSLRHTAIVTAIRSGISNQIIASNARTSVNMVERFYGSHVRSSLNMGNAVVNSVKAKRESHARKAEEKATAKAAKQAAKTSTTDSATS